MYDFLDRISPLMNDLEDERIQENSTPFDNYWYKDKKKPQKLSQTF